MILTAETIDQIICQIFNEKDIHLCAEHYTDNNIFNDSTYGQDIVQEMMLSLIEMPQQKLKNLYYSGILKYYVLGGIRNMSISDQSKFYRKNGFKKPDVHKYEKRLFLDDVKDYKVEVDSIYIQARERLNRAIKDDKKRYILNFVFEHYFENKLSGHRIAALTKLSSSTVYNYLTLIKNIIKS